MAKLRIIVGAVHRQRNVHGKCTGLILEYVPLPAITSVFDVALYATWGEGREEGNKIIQNLLFTPAFLQLLYTRDSFLSFSLCLPQWSNRSQKRIGMLTSSTSYYINDVNNHKLDVVISNIILNQDVFSMNILLASKHWQNDIGKYF